MKKLTVGLVGLGTVGKSVFNLLNTLNLENVRIKIVVEKDIRKKKIVKGKNVLFTTNFNKILDDDEINVVIEVIGGIKDAKGIVISALNKGKNVITANKALLAEYQDIIFKIANNKNLFVGYRAAITGAHTILPHLILAGTINTLIGILNGTCNYILTKMEEENLDFNEALKEAQKRGYAEHSPQLDINGYDTADKLLLLNSLISSSICKKENIYIEGIENITLSDIKFASELGYRIKLLGIIKKEDDKKDIRVHPALIDNNSSLAKLKGIDNGLIIDDKFRGRSSVTSPGAGGYPAASAIIADLIALRKGDAGYYPKELKKEKLKSINEVITKYFLRFEALNKPGVLAKITKILGKFNINIRSVLQKSPQEKRSRFVPVIILTDDAKEVFLQKAVRIIDKLDVIGRKTTLIRIEEEVW